MDNDGTHTAIQDIRSDISEIKESLRDLVRHIDNTFVRKEVYIAHQKQVEERTEKIERTLFGTAATVATSVLGGVTSLLVWFFTSQSE